MFGRVARIAEVGAAAVVASAVTLTMTAGQHVASADDMSRVTDVVRAESGASQAQDVNATYWLTVPGITGVSSTGPSQHRNDIPVASWSFSAQVPHDANTGAITGRTSYGPLMISANTTTATPQLLNDLSTNQNLTTVTLSEFLRTGGEGPVTAFLKLVLTDVTVSKFSAGGTGGSASDTYEFTYRKLQLTVGNKTVNVDTSAGG
jgi:type VI secretion system Hcp family effector